MKLQSVKYSKSDKWYSNEFLPDNPRSVLLYVEEEGTLEGKYEHNEWFAYRWNCTVNPLKWREMPRYDSSDSSL